jgi:hypothetical protein
MGRFAAGLLAWSLLGACAPAEPTTDDQALATNVAGVIKALDQFKAPLAGVDAKALAAAIAKADGAKLQVLLDPHALVVVSINPEARVKAARGEGPAVLRQGRPVPLLVKVVNEAGVTARLRAHSPQAVAAGGFLEVKVHGDPPLSANLSGRPVEYALLLVTSTQAGRREATLAFDAGQGTQDLGFRGEVPTLFTVRPAGE